MRLSSALKRGTEPDLFRRRPAGYRYHWPLRQSPKPWSCQESVRRPTGPLVCAASSDGYAQVVDWLDFFGGFVDDALVMSDQTPCGARGIVASRPIDAARLAAGPLAQVPDKLCMSAAAAERTLTAPLQACGLPVPHGMGEEALVALLLAHERNKGRSSTWFPYIETLPQQPSCTWRIPPDELEADVRALGLDVEGWQESVRSTAVQHIMQAELIWDEYGDALDVSLEDYLWGLQQVHSRSYDASATLIPFVDLLNHDADAFPPLGLRDDSGEPQTAVSSFQRGAPLPLAPGEELFVTYNFKGSESPLQVYLHFGFLPPEVKLGLIPDDDEYEDEGF